MKFVDEATLYVKAGMAVEDVSALEEKSTCREAVRTEATEEKGET
jgi:hypothetical protein